MLRKHGPVILVVVVALFVMVVTDLAAANIYKLFKDESWYAQPYIPAGIEQQYRIKHPVYHHDLAQNYATDKAAWGGNI